jgi:signal transduction histidine kinase
MLSFMGLSYVLFETFIFHEHEAPHTQLPLLVGVILLSVVGPGVTYLGLNWAWKTSARLDNAESNLREHNRNLETIAEISWIANSSLDLDQILNESLVRLMELITVDSCAVWLRNGDHLQLKAAYGETEQFQLDQHIHMLDHCFCNEVAINELPMTLEDLNCGQEFIAARCSCEQFTSASGIPLLSGNKLIGVLEVATNRSREFGPAELEMLASIGYQIGTAVEKAQLHQQLQDLNDDLESLVDLRTAELVQAKEELVQKAETLRELLVRVHNVEEGTRAHIASDLHDGVQQLINGALFEVQALRLALQNNPETADQQLAQLQAVLQQIETGMRDAVYSLRPVTLDTLGLVAALRECVHSFERSSGTTCRLQVEGNPCRFNHDAELAAFRIVQEALNNVEAHAQASNCTVQVHFCPAQIQLEIRDNGNGFNILDYHHNQRSQLGLIGMQERAASVGGQLETISENNVGTRVIFTLSLPQEEK